MLDHRLAGVCLGLTDPDLSRVLVISLWVMLAAVLAISALYVALAVKRYLQREARPEPLTLQDLREMRARNEISDQEFAALRAAILGRMDDGAPRSNRENQDDQGQSPPDHPGPADHA